MRHGWKMGDSEPSEGIWPRQTCTENGCIQRFGPVSLRNSFDIPKECQKVDFDASAI
jgi:hypothetical protein